MRLTPHGRSRHAAAQADIHAMEYDLLGDLGAAERELLLAALHGLASIHTEDLSNR